MSDESWSRQMERPVGRRVRPADRIEAAWYVIEDGAYPVWPDHFPWPEVVALTYPNRINPDVYLPGSAL